MFAVSMIDHLLKRVHFT